jgi:hypothetical protein
MKIVRTGLQTRPTRMSQDGSGEPPQKESVELAEFDAVYIETGVGGDSFGLFRNWDAEMLASSMQRVSMGGMLCGALFMEGSAQGI